MSKPNHLLGLHPLSSKKNNRFDHRGNADGKGDDELQDFRQSMNARHYPFESRMALPFSDSQGPRVQAFRYNGKQRSSQVTPHFVGSGQRKRKPFVCVAFAFLRNMP